MGMFSSGSPSKVKIVQIEARIAAMKANLAPAERPWWRHGAIGWDDGEGRKKEAARGLPEEGGGI